MKNVMTSTIILLFTIFGCTMMDGQLSNIGFDGNSEDTSTQTKAADPDSFSLSGFADTNGGTEGEVVRVTNLSNSGPGSFRHAVEEVNGSRLIVFEVGGVIDLEEQAIVISDPFLTIAGQTAPSPGITLIKGGIKISGTNDVVIEHIAVRPGDAGNVEGSGWAPDGISVNSSEDVIIRNCSITWAIDEGLTASGPRDPSTSRKISFINNIIGQSLHDSSHPKGPHSKGSLIHDFVQDIAVIGNLYAHNYDRNPKFKGSNLGIVVNNVIYNPGVRVIGMSYDTSTPDISNSKISVVGNYLLHGQDTPTTKELVWAQTPNLGEAFMEDNVAKKTNGTSAPLVNSEVINLDDKPSWPDGLVPLPVNESLDYVLNNAGARPWDRDPIDENIIQSVLQKSGNIIDSQDEVGGYPDYPPTFRTLSVPETNRNEWLDSMEKGCAGSKECS